MLKNLVLGFYRMQFQRDRDEPTPAISGNPEPQQSSVFSLIFVSVLSRTAEVPRAGHMKCIENLELQIEMIA